MSVAYVIAAYFGPRRVKDHIYRADMLTYLRMHLRRLDQIRTDFDLIEIVCNECNEGDFRRFTSWIPKHIHGIPVSVIRRDNKGWSYFAFFDAFLRHRSDFDYYILMEDDQLPCLDNLSSKMLEILGDRVAISSLVSQHRHLVGYHFIGWPILIRSDIAQAVAAAARYDFKDLKFNYRLGSEIQFYLANHIHTKMKQKIGGIVEHYAFDMWKRPYYLERFCWDGSLTQPLICESSQKYTMNLKYGVRPQIENAV